MTIKAGDRIADLDGLWSGKVRSMSKKWALVDLPSHDTAVIRRCKIKYNNELGCFIHERRNQN